MARVTRKFVRFEFTPIHDGNSFNSFQLFTTMACTVVLSYNDEPFNASSKRIGVRRLIVSISHVLNRIFFIISII